MVKDGFNKNLKYLAFITQLGITMLAPIALCMFVAIYLTGRFGIGQWIIIVAILLGLMAGGLNVYKMMMVALKKNKNEN